MMAALPLNTYQTCVLMYVFLRFALAGKKEPEKLFFQTDEVILDTIKNKNPICHG